VKIISSDSHVIEPPTLWQEYCAPEFRERAPRLEHVETGDRLVCDGLELAPLGLLAGCLRRDDEVRETGTWEDDIPATAYDPAARRRAVEEDGVSGEVLFPTVGMSFYLLDDVALQRALFTAYNRWLAEFCASDPAFYRGLAVLCVDDVQAAVEDVEACHEMGLRGAVVPLFAGEDNPYQGEAFEPLWEAASRLRMPINMHSSTSRDKNAVWTKGRLSERLLRQPVQMQQVILDMIFSGVFDRHPDLVLVSAENDIGWAGHLTERSDYWWQRLRALTTNAEEMKCAQAPSTYFGTNVTGTFMRDRTGVLAASVIGADAIMFGSDFPHHVSTWPHTTKIVAEHLEAAPRDVAEKIAWRNVARLYDFE
jgi:predicted TIM-barrel fold metal-dependent hydrolase